MLFLKKKTDLILLHAPSIYDFRKMPHLLGPVSDVVPSTPIFEMYPVGFSTLAEFLMSQGFRVRIINLAFRMLKSRRFQPENFLRRLKPAVFGIDLHWLPHAHGSIEIAKICKKLHPKIPVLMGGFSASYFHEELIRYPAVDIVIRGDSTEEITAAVVEKIRSGNFDLSGIPNVTWKKNDGTVIINETVTVEPNLNLYSNNYRNLFKMSVRNSDVWNMTAIRDWWQYPIAAIMTCRGCTQDCVICGGSRTALKQISGRKKPSYREPEKVAGDVHEMTRYTRAPIFVIGDLNQFGRSYADRFFETLLQQSFSNELIIELFNPGKSDFFDHFKKAKINFNVEMSPESHDTRIRQAAGKSFSNEQLETSIQAALAAGCGKFDVFFMIGLPQQTTESVMETVDYCEKLLQQFGKKVTPFISPLAPFLDPGSRAYENPEEHGYRVFFRTLEQHRQALLQPSWKYMLNYETQWMDREALVQATYEAGRRLTEIKARFGVISDAEKKHTLGNLSRAIERNQKIDDFYRNKNAGEPVLTNMEQDSISTICHKRELRWPNPSWSFRIWNIIKAIILE